MAFTTVFLVALVFAIPTALHEGMKWLGRKAQSRRETRYIRQRLKGDYQYDFMP